MDQKYITWFYLYDIFFILYGDLVLFLHVKGIVHSNFVMICCIKPARLPSYCRVWYIYIFFWELNNIGKNLKRAAWTLPQILFCGEKKISHVGFGKTWRFIFCTNCPFKMQVRHLRHPELKNHQIKSTWQFKAWLGLLHFEMPYPQLRHLYHWFPGRKRAMAGLSWTRVTL